MNNKSGNKVVNDFIRNANTNINNIDDILEFIPFDKFKDIEYLSKVKAYKATWINDNIQGWNEEKINFKRSGPMQIILKKLDNSENITSKELNEVHINLS